MNISNRSFAHRIITVIVGILIFTMLAVVVYDRYEFHNLVNEVASIDVGTIKRQQRGAEIDSSKISIDSSIINIANPQKTNNNVDDLSDLLQKTDGLLSANGLTYLVTLIVALLASFLINKLDKMEEAINVAKASNEKAKASNEKMEEAINVAMASQKGIEEATKVAMELKEKIFNLRGELSKSLNNIEILENKTESYYKHIRIFYHILNQIASIFNLSIMISNATSMLSLSKGNEDNEKIAAEVGGSLCSRLDLIYDYNIKNSKIDYLTTDEKNVLTTYLDDAQSALNRSQKSTNKEKLKVCINRNINSVKKIIEMIDNVDIQDENKADERTVL